ncbi:MAG: hypothetical protein Tsb0013_18000 [Phycisphaerales bacterium]
MERVARYTSMVLAEQAAMRLREEGINARVVGHMVRDFYISLDRRPYEVMIADKADSERAKAIIASMHVDDTPAEIEEDAWRPDISGLDPDEFSVACPRCATALALDASLEACPSCNTPLDVIELIAQRYGPEAFDGLEQASDALEADGGGVIDTGERCRSCQAPLNGLPLTGRCPSCGSLYASELQP